MQAGSVSAGWVGTVAVISVVVVVQVIVRWWVEWDKDIHCRRAARWTSSLRHLKWRCAACRSTTNSPACWTCWGRRLELPPSGSVTWRSRTSGSCPGRRWSRTEKTVTTTSMTTRRDWRRHSIRSKRSKSLRYTLCFKKSSPLGLSWYLREMKTNLNNIWQNDLTKFATKLYATNVRFIRWASLLQVSKWDSIFFQFNNETIETSRFRQFLWSQYELLLPTLASYYLHDRSLLMSRHNIIFYLFFSYLFSSMGNITRVRQRDLSSVRRVAW